MYYKQSNSAFEEAKSFLEESGVLVVARDIVKQPLNKGELKLMLGFHNPKHYLDVTSAVYQKQKLDTAIPPRDELFDMILAHPELLRQPIILAGRLMTIGTGKKQLVDMFQISGSDNGSKHRERAGKDDRR